MVYFGYNSATGWGGGLHSYNSSPTLIDVEFLGNQAGCCGGGLSLLASSTSLTDVTFRGTAP